MTLQITALPTPPSRQDPSNFSARADTFLGALPTFATETNALAVEVNTNATTQVGIATTQAGIATTQAGIATTQAGIATTQASDAAGSAVLAQQAAISAGAIAWVSGTTYAIGALRYSPIDYQTYRRKTAGAGTTDPSLDSTNWIRAISANILRSVRTSNTAIVPSDQGAFIDIVSGTFTQTFAAVASFSSGWWCWLRNSGTGDITLDPFGTETIDSLTSFVMYPGETRLVQCDGTALRSVVLTSFYKAFVANGTFIKPPGYSLFSGMLWGAGGSGAACISGAYVASGGGGGACVTFTLSSASVAASQALTVGGGGLAVSSGISGGSDGNIGGDSVFAGITAYGGGGGSQGGSGVSWFGGGGGGWLSAGSTGGGGGNPSGPFGNSGYSIYGGGSGGSGGTSPQPGSNSYFGGGGGAGVYTAARAGGASNFGGSGGASSTTAGVAAGSGSIPGGGGGAHGMQTNSYSGDGGRGEVRIWGVV